MINLDETLHWRNADVEVHRLVVGPLDNNVFVIRCRQSGEAVLLDAADEHQLLVELADATGVRRICETHGHWDHIGAVTEMRERGFEVGVNALDAPMLAEVGYDVLLDDAEVIEFGRCRLDLIHTPGHTPGSICFKLAKTPLLFSGDTLFPGGPGTTALEGGDFATIIDSIDRHLFAFDDDTIVLPGHGADTTIGAERPQLEAWVARGY